MKKMRIGWILMGMMAIGVLSMAGNMGVLAAGDCGDDAVETSILGTDGCYTDDGSGGGIYDILNIILTVLTYGVGIAATVGLVIVGIQYATAGTNEAQVAKAKKRILEIVIGIVAYAVMYAALQWLLPGGIF